MKLLTIKQLSEQSDVPIGTIRFYERKELIASPQRTPSGYRQYDPEIILQLRFIKQAQRVGFTLNEINELLRLRMTTGSTKADIKKRALKKIQDTDRKISTLNKVKYALEEITQACDGGKGPVGECPIILALEKTDMKAKYQF